MVLNSSESFVIYQLPYSNQRFYRTGTWNKYTQQTQGFIIQSFNNQKSFILEGKKQLLDTSDIQINLPNKEQRNNALNREQYLKQLNTFIQACQKDIDKVISSRIINQKIPSDFDLFNAFEKLATQNKNALVYILNIPNIGMWMGATPETLLRSSPTETYTIALAGSQDNNNLKPWEEKEIEEHEYVIEDISKKLNQKHISHSIGKMQTITAGKVAHLKTRIDIQSKLADIKTVAESLHPTSAVCGMPQAKAYQFILENEPYNREFYTGYLGEVETPENTWLFVNLRCMQLFKNTATLYVGGGITKASISEKEWVETQLKSQTLLAVIEKI